ncbi:MAG: ATP-binding protein [Deltaproteobacteria bacterium]|nr:ATP-binding protein [Deltaproteobacteria bacterium]
MAEVYGDFVEFEEVFEYLVISFDSSRLTVKERWKGNSISADFLAAYWGSLGPAFHPRLAHTQMKDTISWTANELIENAVKFADTSGFFPIKIFLNLAEDTLDFYVENSVSADAKKKLIDRIVEIQNNDASDLYFQQVEKNAVSDSDESSLGFLIMKMDLGAEIAWKFEKKESPNQRGIYVDTVITLVRVPIEKSDVS